MPELEAWVDQLDTARPFGIARAVKTRVGVLRVALSEGGRLGRGEATPIDYRGDDAGQALALARSAAGPLASGLDRAGLLDLLPPGAARNALDAALWDLEAKKSGRRVWQLLGLPPPRPLLTAATVGLDTPAHMAEAARGLAARELLKVKLGAEGDEERLAAVRRAAPHARLIVDANGGWAGRDLEALLECCHRHRVELVEQPLPPGDDAILRAVRSLVPLAADESLHDRADLDRIVGCYRIINVKLDKCGGLTEALALISAARQRGLGVMVGCMLSSSLGIAPAFMAAMGADHADLDGPTWLARDIADGLEYSGSDVHPPSALLWG